MFKAIFFDAVGTLFYLPQPVGDHYALAAREVGLQLDAKSLDRAFATVWKTMPARPATGLPREADDKGWWRDLVDRMIDQAAPTMHELDRDAFFEVAYSHFAEAGVWQLYRETYAVLETLSSRAQLGIISNFDGRLRMILEHLGISRFFQHVFISSEVGADKPDALIYRRALYAVNALPNETLYVGDDPVRDWGGAEALGITVFRLDRPGNSLHDLLPTL